MSPKNNYQPDDKDITWLGDLIITTFMTVLVAFFTAWILVAPLLIYCMFLGMPSTQLGVAFFYWAYNPYLWIVAFVIAVLVVNYYVKKWRG